MIENLFPTRIYHDDLLKNHKNKKKFLQDLIAEIYKIAEHDEEGQHWSRKNYYKGYTSYGSSHSGFDRLYLFSSTFLDIKNKLDKHVYKFAKHLELNVQPKDLEISKLWINIMTNSVIHTGHIHPLSVISGTFYVDIPEKAAPALKFEDPRFQMMMAVPPKKEKLKKENLNFYAFVPKAGQVVLFESWLRHEVCQNTTNKNRISISFNYDWV